MQNLVFVINFPPSFPSPTRPWAQPSVYILLQAILSWLPKAEEKMANMPPMAADTRRLRIQLEELKVP